LATYGPYGDIAGCLSKESVKDIPMIGSLSISYQNIFVNKSSKNDRTSSIKAIKERTNAINRGENFGKIQIFPEGTRTNGSHIIKKCVNSDFPEELLFMDKNYRLYYMISQINILP
jgi:1-acyl-sn-glycerol-3-phosphate acyltransferase